MVEGALHSRPPTRMSGRKGGRALSRAQACLSGHPTRSVACRPASLMHATQARPPTPAHRSQPLAGGGQVAVLLRVVQQEGAAQVVPNQQVWDLVHLRNQNERNSKHSGVRTCTPTE